MSSRKVLVSKGVGQLSRLEQSQQHANPPAAKAPTTAWGNEFRPAVAPERNGHPAISISKINDQYAPDNRQSRYNPSQVRKTPGSAVRSGMPDMASLSLKPQPSRPPPGDILHKSQFELGMIFSTTQHEAKIEGMELDSRFTTESQHGTICSKLRPMIVVSLFDRHCVALPLFTHNARGLQGKKIQEYVSVRDSRLGGEIMLLSNHKPLLTGRMVAGSSVIKSESTAQLTYPVSVRYGSRVVLWGHLTHDSLVELQILYGSTIPKVKKRC